MTSCIESSTAAQLLDVDGFDEVGGKSRARGLRAVLHLAVPGDGDEPGAPQPRVLREAARDLEAVDHRQAKVEQRDVRLELLRPR